MGHRGSSLSSSSLARVDAPRAHGRAHITGVVLGHGAGWRAITDDLGWTNVVLWSQPTACGDVDGLLRAEARDRVHPARLAHSLAVWLDAGGCGAEGLGLAIARVSPCGQLVELFNATLPTVLAWDPLEGLVPYEPLAARVSDLPAGSVAEILRLEPGAAIVLATESLVAGDASFDELRSFAVALGVDPLGGGLAETTSAELARIVRSSWSFDPRSPAGLVVIGSPLAIQRVA